MRIVLRSAIVLPLLWVLACSTATSATSTVTSPSTGTDGGAAPVEGGAEGEPEPVEVEETSSFTSVDDACDAYAAAKCDVEASCGNDLFRARWYTRARCLSGRRQECLTRAVAADAPAVKVASIGACAAALAHLSCDDLDTRVLPAPCDWRGSRAIDVACGVGSQCQSGYCPFVNATVCWTCARPAAVGEGCSDDTYCEPGLVCAYGVCKKPARRGQSCASAPCAAPATCKAGTCVVEHPTLREPGKSCDVLAAPSEERCAGGFCSDAGKCVLLAGPGEACDLPSDCMRPFVCLPDGGATRCGAADPRKC